MPDGKLIRAMRWPSVATISILFGCTLSSAPLSWKRVSSCVIANFTLPTIVFSSSSGIVYASPHVHRRQRRVVLGRQTEEAELRGAGLDEHRVVFLQRHVDVFVGKRADDVEEALRFDGHAAGRGDARGAGAEDRDVEIGRGDLQPSVGGLEQDVRQNRNRRALLDDSLAKLEFLLKIRFSDGQLHVVSSFKTRSLFSCSGSSRCVRINVGTRRKGSKV